MSQSTSPIYCYTTHSVVMIRRSCYSLTSKHTQICKLSSPPRAWQMVHPVPMSSIIWLLITPASTCVDKFWAYHYNRLIFCLPIIQSPFSCTLFPVNIASIRPPFFPPRASVCEFCSPCLYHLDAFGANQELKTLLGGGRYPFFSQGVQTAVANAAMPWNLLLKYQHDNVITHNLDIFPHQYFLIRILFLNNGGR